MRPQKNSGSFLSSGTGDSGGCSPSDSHCEDMIHYVNRMWAFHIPTPSGSIKRGHICLCEQPLQHKAETLLM